MPRPAIFVQSPMMQRSDLSAPPNLFPSIDGNFFHAVGHLIVMWGLMEQQLNVLVWALLAANGTEEKEWRYRPFEKRFGLLKSEWDKFSKGLPTLARFPSDTFEQVRAGKALRDSISHKEMVLGMQMDGNHFIQFYHKTRAKQKSKPYHRSDFESAAIDAQRAAGWFYWVCQENAAWPLPLEDRERLKSLPRTEHLRLPT